MANIPGEEGIGRRQLHFIYILDCSGSMQGKKIETLNFAIRDTIPAMQEAAKANINAEVLVRAVKFSDGAQWHIAKPVDVEHFRWSDLDADGVTDLGRALTMVADALADALKAPNMSHRLLPPVLLLVSDGQPTDDFKGGLKTLMSQPAGKKAVRLAIAVGDDADIDVLQEFIGDPERKPVVAANAATLVKYIKWASTTVVRAVSHVASDSGDRTRPSGGVKIPGSFRPDPGPADWGSE